MNTQADRHRVVIIGAGFGGLFASRALRDAPVDLIVVDRTNHHLFQALLYQVATGVLSEGDIAPPIRGVLRTQRNARVKLGEVKHIDLAAREVALEMLGKRERIPYDSLIVAAGSGQSYFGHDEFASEAPGMKTIDDALEVRGRILGAFEMAELESDPELRKPWLTFVVVGAGQTGIELAGQIAELARRALKDNFRTIDPASARVIVLDAGDVVLAPFPARLRRRARRDLEQLGIEVRLGATVTGIDAEGLDLTLKDGSSDRIEARAKVWAAGVHASPLGAILAEQSDATVDRAGRVSVRPDCTLPGYPEVFVIGDMMGLGDVHGVAEVAMQSGVHASRTIARRLTGDTDERPFRYRDLGTMATISRFRAVAYRGRLCVTGSLAWLMWLFVHLAFLTGFKNRVSVLANWGAAFLGRGRPQRTITARQALARTRHNEAGSAAKRSHARA